MFIELTRPKIYSERNVFRQKSKKNNVKFDKYLASNDTEWKDEWQLQQGRTHVLSAAKRRIQIK